MTKDMGLLCYISGDSTIRAIGKTSFKVPNGKTTIYELESSFHPIKQYPEHTIIYSKTISNKGEETIFSCFAHSWKNRNRSDYKSKGKNGMTDSLVESFEKAIEEYEKFSQ
jgi:hypothetical protein